MQRPKPRLPALLAVHGYINSRETQDGFAIEFGAARAMSCWLWISAATVIATDPLSPMVWRPGRGWPICVASTSSDKDNIGLEGHSMGGWTVLAAAITSPNDYKSMVLAGSSVGKPFAAEGSPSWPRNIALIEGQYDEFSKLMWDVDKAADVGQSPKLQALFGTDKPVEVGKLYGTMAAGDARLLYQPAISHTGEHFTNVSIGDAIDWFAQTLKGGAELPASDQIWYWKELGTLISLVGFVVSWLGAFEVTLTLPAFASLAHDPTPARLERGRGWWIAFVLAALLPAITYFPLAAVAMPS